MTIDHNVLVDALAVGTATLHEAAGRTGDLPPTLRRVAGSRSVAGPAFTVLCPPGDNLWIHRAIYSAAPGDVLVVGTGDETARWGYWGEIMTIAAQQAGLAGLVLEGGTRDHDALAELSWPTWSLGPCIRGTVKDKTRGQGRLGEPIQLGDVTIHPGDLIVADTDGAVAIAQHAVHEVIRRSHERVTKERDAMNQLRHGGTTLDLYDLY